jgi:hypothetical protein
MPKDGHVERFGRLIDSYAQAAGFQARLALDFQPPAAEAVGDAIPCEACGHPPHEDKPCPECGCEEGMSFGQELKPKDGEAALGAFGSGHPMGAADLKQKALHDSKAGQHGALATHHAAEAHKAMSAKKSALADKHSTASKAHNAAKAAHELARSQPPDHPSHAIAEKKSAMAQAASDGTADVVPQKAEPADGQQLGGPGSGIHKHHTEKDMGSAEHSAAAKDHAAAAEAAGRAGNKELQAVHNAAWQAHVTASQNYAKANGAESEAGAFAKADQSSKDAQKATEKANKAEGKASQANPLRASHAVTTKAESTKKIGQWAASSDDAQALSSDQLSRLVPAPDDELPPHLRGKGLVRGQPVATWMLGRNETRDGRVFIVDDKAVQSLLADGNSHSFAPLTYVHEDGETQNAGYAVTGNGKGFSVGALGPNRFLFCDRPYWTGKAAADIASGHRGPISPDVNIEPLDPKTLEVLTPSSQLYAGPGRGRFGTSYNTNTFRPVTWRVPASLVPVPANRHLPTASLSATASASQKLERSKTMIDYQLLGLAANATEAQKQTVRRKIRALIAKAATAKLAASETFDKETILTLVRNAYKIPAVVNDDQLSGMIDDALDGGVDDSTEDGTSPTPAADGVPQPAAAAVVPVAKLEPDPAIAAAAAVASAATAIRKELDEKEVAKLKAEKDKGIDDLLKTAEAAGKLVAARREEMRARLSSDVTADFARAELASMRPGFIVPDAQILGGSYDRSISVDDLPTAEALEILSRACAWNELNGRHPRDFSQSLSDVRGGNPLEEAYHREVLASIPDWSPALAQDNKPFGGRTKKTGEKWAQRLCASQLQPKKDFDFDKLGHIFGKMRDPDVSNQLSALGFGRDAQKMSLSLYGASQKLAGETGYFQPAARFPIPSFAYGVLMGEYGGSEIAQEFQGGVNKQVYYPIYGNEALRVFVNSGTSIIDPIGPESMSKPSMKRAYEYKLVNLKGYGNIQWVDRDEAMSADTVLPIGLMAMATQDAMYYGKNEKEYNQAQYLRNTAHYTSGFYADLSTGGQFTDPSSKLVQAVKAARLKIWAAVGAYQQSQLVTLASPYVIEALSVHPQVLTAAQTAGLGHLDRPMAYAPQELLVALFGPFIVPTCRISTAMDGSNADSPWGTDMITAVVSREIIAPRAFVTVTGGGYPITQAVAEPVGHGLRGRDGLDFSDVYAVETSGATGATTSSAYLWQNAVAVMTP